MGEDRTAATSQHKPVQILVPFVLLQLKKKKKKKTKNPNKQTSSVWVCLFFFFNVQNKIALRFPTHMSKCEPTRTFQGLVVNFQNRGEENGNDR